MRTHVWNPDANLILISYANLILISYANRSWPQMRTQLMSYANWFHRCEHNCDTFAPSTSTTPKSSFRSFANIDFPVLLDFAFFFTNRPSIINPIVNPKSKLIYSLIFPKITTKNYVTVQFFNISPNMIIEIKIKLLISVNEPKQKPISISKSFNHQSSIPNVSIVHPSNRNQYSKLSLCVQLLNLRFSTLSVILFDQRKW